MRISKLATPLLFVAITAFAVAGCEREGPAESAGVRDGDLIVALNGQTVRSIDDLQRFLTEWPLRRSVSLTLIRGTERHELGVMPGEAKS